MKIISARHSFKDVIAIASFRNLWFGQIFSQLASNITLFTLALIVYQTTGSNTAVSGLFLSYGIPALLFGVVAGIIVDHLDKKRVLIACDISRAFLVIGMFFVFRNPVLVYVLLFFHAVLTQFYVPAEAPMIPRLVPDSMLVSANSLFSFTFYSSMAVGFIIAGPLLRIVGPQITFIIIAALFLLASVSVAKLSYPSTHSVGLLLSKDIKYLFFRVIQDLKRGTAYVTHAPVLFDALILLTGTQIILMVLGTLGPGFADRVLQIDVREASLVMSAPVVLGIIAGALWVGSVGYAFSPNRLIKTGILSAGILLMLISLTVRLSNVAGFSFFFDSFLKIPIILILFFLLGIANSFLDVPANSSLQREAQGDMRGRIYGMFTAAVGGVGILPVVAGGLLADAIGVGKVIFFLGLLISTYGIYRIKYYNG